MKTQFRIASFCFFAALCLALADLPAMADDIIYSNGPYDGTTTAYSISDGSVVSNSFSLGKAAQIKALSFTAWLYPGDTIASFDGSFTSGPNGGTTDAAFTTSKSGIKSVSLGINEYGYELEQVTYDSLNVNLDAGTYWLNLQNAATDQGDPLFWDQNNGPSQAYDSAVGTIPSESFNLTGGGGGTTPEPSSLALFGSGALGLGGLLRRRFLG